MSQTIDFEVKLEFDEELKNIMSNMLSLQNELADLVPEWNIEKIKLCDELSSLWNELLDYSIKRKNK
jgi:hypothetical protein